MTEPGDTAASRRCFCAAACRAASAWLAAAAFPAGRSEALRAARDSAPLPTIRADVDENRVTVRTESTPLAAVGGRARIASNVGSFLVTRTDERTFLVLTAICSHEACLITDVDDEAYVCPCHGSRFEASGNVLTGPAELPLYRFDTTFSDGVLVIQL
ncbi:MAG: Rieske (2Fe-2S) protein [Acidobacteria bacterium]|nr:Rieske (2Fe-2S) protein [Acidobacteriota bacterium]